MQKAAAPRGTSIIVFRWILLVVTSILSYAALVLPLASRPTSLPLKEGEVAPQDILAPKALEYTSQVLTEQARKDAESTVNPIYLSADLEITRRQIEHLSQSLAYISTVKSDTYSSNEHKRIAISSLPDLQLSSETIEKILSLTDSRWKTLQQEAVVIIEQVMRNSIRPDQLNGVKKNIPYLISFSIPQDQTQIITELVTTFIIPNSVYSEESTRKAILVARDSIQPINRSYAQGEIIVRRGQLISPANWEALNYFGLIKSKIDLQGILAPAALILLIFVSIGLYVSKKQLISNGHFLTLLIPIATYLIFLYTARLIIPNRVVIPFLFPMAALGLAIASTFSLEIGLAVSLILSVLVSYGLPISLNLTSFYFLSSLCGILVLGKGKRISNFLWSGLAIGGAGTAVILAYRLPDPISDWIGIATLIGASFANGIASASLTLLLQYVFAQILGQTTALQLMEISRPDQPLLQIMLRNAPGTYQHSLQVANLAEQAAEAIGADGMLVRVGAIYHDVGKAENSSFFIENQIPGKLNTHDDLDPVFSAQTILKHVIDGVKLANKYRLPLRIVDFIREHHGTLLTSYQYTRAVQAVNNQLELVNKELFRYPGPAPRSKETALLMLADGCEAKVRASLPKDEDEVRTLVKKVFTYIQEEGQLDNTPLTLHDIQIVMETMVRILQNTHHPRIEYPELNVEKNPNQRV